MPEPEIALTEQGHTHPFREWTPDLAAADIAQAIGSSTDEVFVHGIEPTQGGMRISVTIYAPYV